MSEGETRCHACGQTIEGPDTHVCPVLATVQERKQGRREAASETPSDAPTPTEPRVGEVLAGRYALLARAGAGGGGTVYRAHDRELGIDVALKVLRRDFVSEDLRSRFKREIRITREIDHPNVSRVFDLGESDGVTFLTMRWIDGESLFRRVQGRGALAKPELRRLAEGLVAALAAAHRQGIVHRDVKPGNVLVSPDGRPVLVDFGIAKDAGATPAGSSPSEPKTAPGQPPGTPAYMAPEQARGDAVLPAADLWALALTLAFAATGRTGEPEDPRGAFAPFGKPLAALLERCLARDPVDRPRDAIALEAALRAHARRRRRLGLSAAGLALVLAGGAAAWALVPAPAPSGSRLVRVTPLENRTGNEDLEWLERGVSDLVTAGLESSGAVHVALEPDATGLAATVRGRVAAQGDRVSVELALVAPNGRVLAEHVVRDPRGDAFFGGVDVAVSRFLSALGAMPEAGTRRRSPRVRVSSDFQAFVHYARAQDLIRKHRYPDAMEELRKATRLDPAFALAQMHRYILVATGSYGPSSEGRAALELAERYRDRLPPAQRDLFDALAETRKGTSRERFDRLRAYLRGHTPETTAYWLASRVLGTEPDLRREILEEWIERIPGDAEPHNVLGYVLLVHFDDPEGAEREFREYLRLSPNEPNAHDSLGDFLRERGQYDEALREYDRAIELDPGFTSAHVEGVVLEILRDDLPAADGRLATALGAVPPESRDFDRLVYAWIGVPLLGGDRARAEARAEEVIGNSAVGSRAYVAHEATAIASAIDGDVASAREHAGEADRLHRLYHGADRGLPSLGPYVEGLAAHRRRDERSLARALDAIRASVGADGLRGPRETLLSGLALLLGGDPSAAAEALAVPLPGGTSGVFFAIGLERARALVGAGRLGEALAAYEEIVDKRQTLAEFPETTSTWSTCLAEAAELARRTGYEERAADLEARRARLVLTPRSGRR